LSSVAIDEIFGTLLNQDPKLLAFTDSVQDASHRAGFFTARTYHFTFRTALQHLIDEAGHVGVPLPQIGQRLLEFASQEQPGRPGSMREAIATLAPPDIREHQHYQEFVHQRNGQQPRQRFHEQFIERLAWEATSEFGMQVSVGRTLEMNGASCLSWDDRLMRRTIEILRRRLQHIDPRLVQVPELTLRTWVYGLLQRYRERGAITHPYIEALANSGLWGKYDWQRRLRPERETHPLAGRRRPRLLSTAPDRTHDFVLAVGAGSRTWQMQWSRRILGLPGVDDTALRDLTQSFLIAGTEAGLLRQIVDQPDKKLYGISWAAASVVSGGEKLVCSETGHVLVRPPNEARFWESAPSLAYNAKDGVYRREGFGDREEYYQRRYRRGAIRRVCATEHTGLLTKPSAEVPSDNEIGSRPAFAAPISAPNDAATSVAVFAASFSSANFPASTVSRAFLAAITNIVPVESFSSVSRFRAEPRPHVRCLSISTPNRIALSFSRSLAEIRFGSPKADLVISHDGSRFESTVRRTVSTSWQPSSGSSLTCPS